MSNPLDATNVKPSLESAQYLQDNWGKAEIDVAARVSKVSVATGGAVGIEADINIVHRSHTIFGAVDIKSNRIAASGYTYMIPHIAQKLGLCHNIVPSIITISQVKRRPCCAKTQCIF